MSNKLASIERITDVRIHTNSDNLSIAKVLGWEVVIKRNEVQVGDMVVYVSIDTILPDKPEFAFLKNKKFRIKPIRLRGAESAGICFPLTILPSKGTADVVEGMDVSELIGVTKYEKPVPAALAGQAFGSFPSFIRITDEDNLRSQPAAVSEMNGRPYYITSKVDGSSGTFFMKDGEFGVCSRRIHLRDTPGNGFWQIARKYDIEAALRAAFPGRNMAIQGEVYGDGIQKNPLGVSGLHFNLFNLWDIDARTYMGYSQLVKFSETHKIPLVVAVDIGDTFAYSLKDLIALANKQVYPNGRPAEGIVIRPQTPFYSEVLHHYWSGKIINENYKDAE